MAVLSQALTGLSIYGNVKDITGSKGDGARAAGMSAWVEAVTGQPMQIINIGGGKARLVMTEQQHTAMRKWLDEQVVNAIKPTDANKKLYIEMGPTFKPWAVKYVIPSAAILFLLGYMTRGILK